MLCLKCCTKPMCVCVCVASDCESLWHDLPGADQSGLAAHPQVVDPHAA